MYTTIDIMYAKITLSKLMQNYRENECLFEVNRTLDQ